MPHPYNRRRPTEHHFLNREDDGSARVRIRFKAPDVPLIEAASGTTNPATWIEETVVREARRVVEEMKAQRRKLPPPKPAPPKPPAE